MNIYSNTSGLLWFFICKKIDLSVYTLECGAVLYFFVLNFVLQNNSVKVFIFGIVFLLTGITARAQLYVLKDHILDSNANRPVLYDSLPKMCDTLYRAFIREDLAGLKPFVPEARYLKSTFDTLAIEYREEQVVYRQQLLYRSLQKDYKKIIKYAKKSKLNMRRLEKGTVTYNYGKNEEGYEYCYVTTECKKRKHAYELKFLAIILNGHWFLGDDLSFREVE